jgi:SHS2 domain-containing protein
MKKSGYEEVPHTADIALRVWSNDFRGLLTTAAKGLYDLMGAEWNERLKSSHVFTLQQGSKEDLLVDFLGELIYLCEDKQIILIDFSFGKVVDQIVVDARGYKLLKLKRLIKAVTYHYLEIDRNEIGFETTITFDI